MQTPKLHSPGGFNPRRVLGAIVFFLIACLKKIAMFFKCHFRSQKLSRINLGHTQKVVKFQKRFFWSKRSIISIGPRNVGCDYTAETHGRSPPVRLAGAGRGESTRRMRFGTMRHAGVFLSMAGHDGSAAGTSIHSRYRSHPYRRRRCAGPRLCVPALRRYVTQRRRRRRRRGRRPHSARAPLRQRR